MKRLGDVVALDWRAGRAPHGARELKPHYARIDAAALAGRAPHGARELKRGARCSP